SLLSTLRCRLFFFQAEDGIRDFHVTGVQTCALPISAWAPLGVFLVAHVLFSGFPHVLWRDHVARTLGAAVARSRPDVPLAAVLRSEERRVGKELSCRQSGDRLYAGKRCSAEGAVEEG